ncbi:unnamed protein product, partial [marine sediment metagenome]
SLSFAQRDIIMSIRDLLKYDGRTKQAKRAVAQARLRIAAATDEDLAELAEIEHKAPGNDVLPSLAERFEDLKRQRAKFREQGIKKSDLECR